MRTESLRTEIETMIAPLLAQRGFELVEVNCRYAGRNLMVRIFADRPEGGITVEECARLNNEISGMLDEKDLIQEQYMLEVSSPGLDRPLKTARDFFRCLNKKVHVFLREQVSGRLEFQGVVLDVMDDSFRLQAPQGTVDIPLTAVTKARQVIE